MPRLLCRTALSCAALWALAASPANAQVLSSSTATGVVQTASSTVKSSLSSSQTSLPQTTTPIPTTQPQSAPSAAAGNGQGPVASNQPTHSSPSTAQPSSSKPSSGSHTESESTPQKAQPATPHSSPTKTEKTSQAQKPASSHDTSSTSTPPKQSPSQPKSSAPPTPSNVEKKVGTASTTPKTPSQPPPRHSSSASTSTKALKPQAPTPTQQTPTSQAAHPPPPRINAASVPTTLQSASTGLPVPGAITQATGALPISAKQTSALAYAVVPALSGTPTTWLTGPGTPLLMALSPVTDALTASNSPLDPSGVLSQTALSTVASQAISAQGIASIFQALPTLLAETAIAPIALDNSQLSLPQTRTAPAATQAPQSTQPPGGFNQTPAPAFSWVTGPMTTPYGFATSRASYPAAANWALASELSRPFGWTYSYEGGSFSRHPLPAPWPAPSYQLPASAPATNLFPPTPNQPAAAPSTSEGSASYMAFLLLTIALAALGVGRRLRLEPATWRPVPFVSLLERPG
jgi:hypothetical protein